MWIVWGWSDEKKKWRILDYITPSPSGWLWWKTAEAIFYMYIDTFKNIKNWAWTLEEKRKLFITAYEPFERRIIEVFWHYIKWLDKNSNPVYAKLSENWLDFVLNQTKPANYYDLLNKIFDNFMASSTATVATTTWNTKTSIDEIIRNPNG